MISTPVADSVSDAQVFPFLNLFHKKLRLQPFNDARTLIANTPVENIHKPIGFEVKLNNFLQSLC